VLPLIGLLGLTGCVSTKDDGTREAYYLGLTKVVSRGDPKNGSVETVTVVGAWADPSGKQSSSTGIGYRSRREIMLPLHCRIVFIVKSDEELDRLIRSFGPMMTGEDKPCTIREP
jgi:hypothetical protein